MTLAGIVLLTLALLGGALGWDLRSRRRLEPALQRLGGTHGLALAHARMFSGPALRGVVNHDSVRVYFEDDGEGNSTTVVEVLPAHPAPVDIALEGRASRLTKLVLGDDVQVGLPAFDARYLLKAADPADLLSRLGARGRDALDRGVGHHGGQVKNGAITIRSKGRLKDPGQISDQIDAALELASALSDHPGHHADALLRHAFEDPDPRYRHRCLRMLFQDYPRSGAGQEGLRRALIDPSPAVRFLAAKEQGPAGHELLRTLLADDALPHDLAGQARAILGVAHAGGLALSRPHEGGQLQVVADEGALMEVEAPPPRVKA